MKKLFVVLMCVIISVLAGCNNENEPEASVDRNFYYKDTKWGMSVSELEALKGAADFRNDMTDDEEEEKKEDILLDLFYYEQVVFDNYSAEEKYLFDANNELEGVVATIKISDIENDLTDQEELKDKGRGYYMEIKDLIAAQYGEPAAEYTAYKDGNEYKTDNVLDLERDDAVICATRWDGDNLRFIYILYFFNENALELRYVAHDKETVERVNEMEAESNGVSQ